MLSFPWIQNGSTQWRRISRMQKTERKAHTAISHNDSIPNRKRQKSTTGTASSILAKNSFLRSYSRSVEKNDVTYRGATLRPKYGLWLARFNTPSRQMMPPAVPSPVSMAMTVPPIIKEMTEKIFPPGPSMTYQQVRQKKQKYIVSTSQDVMGIQSLNATIIRQPPLSYIL